jgi:hypothetical protein
MECKVCGKKNGSDTLRGESLRGLKGGNPDARRGAEKPDKAEDRPEGPGRNAGFKALI